jgi:uncharacterized protein (TIGR01777 family)
MKIAMTGATGFVGSYLGEKFARAGHTVAPVSRKDLGGDGDGLPEILRHAEVVVNLAGAPIIKKWTRQYKEELYASRVETTRKVVAAMKSLKERPRALVSASAIGIYASGETRTHTEKNNELAQDFLGALARDWEQAALEAEELGVRTVLFRFGVVLGRGGGALQAMLPPFKAGLGGTIGDGSQPFSWVHIEDLARAFRAAIEDDSFRGIYNLTAPNPVTNKELTRVLAKALGRPAVFRVPTMVLKLQFGEGAQVLTKGQRVLPERLTESGFEFRFKDIESAIRDCLE